MASRGYREREEAERDALPARVDAHLRIAQAARVYTKARQAASRPVGNFACTARALDALLAAVDAEQAGRES